MSIVKEIPFGRPWLDDKDKQAVMEVLEGHILTHGPKCKEFENKFVQFVQGGYAVTTSSCMASLHLASFHFRLKPDDEVLVPAQTHVATAHAIELMGATPVFVDCELATGNIDIHQIEKNISDRTKAISLVHFAGIPARLDQICAIAVKHRLIIIEDCALALGSFYKGKHVGLWGDVGCFSFYPAKHITTAEGGMLLAKNKKVIDDVALFRAFSVDNSHANRVVPGIYDVIGVGLNYRMSELQAALGSTQLNKFQLNLQKRKKNFQKLKTSLQMMPEVRHVLDIQDSEGNNSYYCLVMILNPKIATKRNDILQALRTAKIGCSVYYPHPVPRLKYYADKYRYDLSAFPNATIISDHSISLPVGPHLGEKDMDIIVDTLKKTIQAIG